MIFNAGDVLYGRGPGTIYFKGSAAQWPERLSMLLPAYTDVIVFGEGGPYNQAVLRNTSGIDAHVWVLENGYFRPDWITVERNGVNGSSALPRDRKAYEPPAPDTPVTRPVGKILPYHVLNISLYHLIQLPGRWMFPRYAAPYTQAPWLQCAGHIRRYFGLAFQPRNRCDTPAIARQGPFFIACLQREGDAQLLRYSHFADNTAFLAEVMNSFAGHAPADARLVVKNHPLDPGLVNLGRITRLLAEERGIAKRVDFIDGGNLAQLCRASRGMVVNNSSAALSALGFHTPVKALGQAFFDFEGLTDQKPLDLFWSDPAEPDPDLFARFRAHVIARSQVNGNYHEPRSMQPTALALASVFENPSRL
ncbi:MAG TPA: capsular biosynthesis protein [Brevundimonas sp.]|jgi:capsular polysaccharide export protein